MMHFVRKIRSPYESKACAVVLMAVVIAALSFFPNVESLREGFMRLFNILAFLLAGVSGIKSAEHFEGQSFRFLRSLLMYLLISPLVLVLPVFIQAFLANNSDAVASISKNFTVGLFANVIIGLIIMLMFGFGRKAVQS